MTTAEARMPFRALLYRQYWKLERRLTPGLRSSQYVFAETLAAAMPDDARWLDLGCGRRPFPDWMPEGEAEVLSRVGHAVGIDLDLSSLTDHRAYRDKIMASSEALPFPDASFDIASANMVVEHLPDPSRTLAEVYRVLRPGGAFLFHTPNRLHWPLWLAAHVPDRVKLPLVAYLEGRRAADVFPTHYRFNDRESIVRAAGAAGFLVDRLDMLSTSATTVMLGPVVVAELAWIRWLRRPQHARLRSNIIGVLRKPVLSS